jgi:hypothetical protein
MVGGTCKIGLQVGESWFILRGMIMGKFLVFLGFVLGAGATVHYLQEVEAASTKYYAATGSFGQQFEVGWETGKRQIELTAWLAIELCVAGAMVIVGMKRVALDKQPVEETPEVAIDLPDRSGNPFKRGEVSGRVLPRGQVWRNRNKFRKTIERPNSDGY